MPKKNFFKIGLLISTGVHFSLIAFFPIWKTTLPPKPDIIEVALIAVAPKELIRPKKVPETPPPPPPTPPAEPKIEQRAAPKLSPVEVAVTPSQNIPLLAPQAKAESKLKVPFPTGLFKPVLFPRAKSMASKKERPVEKPLQESIIKTELPSRISSPIQGETPSFIPSTGGEESENIAIQGMTGIIFEGLGARKVVYKPEFTYPPEMERQGQEGSGGIVEVDVASNGHVVGIRIIRSLGSPEFDQEIIRKASRYKFSSIDEPGIKTYPGEFKFGLK